MLIQPLPQFEADMKEIEADRRAYRAMKPPRTIVVRYGYMKMIGEFPYRGDEKPGCGSKIVVQTHRGIEIGEMLTSTCPNSGCSKSVSREEMLRYIENSGGRDYPFGTNGRALRVATREDVAKQTELESRTLEMVMDARARAGRLGLTVKVVQAEPILGGERITFYYASEERMDLSALAEQLAGVYNTRIDMRQVGARDEARLVADYERCGQYCCCKNFLKVLRPVSMRSAKTQKATLDPLKISGRCGRLMCCLRYEDETYESLRKRLPNRKSRVGTPDGDGTVIDSQILTQLVLVRLDSDGRDIAVPVEELTPAGAAAAPMPPPSPTKRDRVRQSESRRSEPPRPAPDRKPDPEQTEPEAGEGDSESAAFKPSRKRVRRKRRRVDGAAPGSPPASEPPRADGPASGESGDASHPPSSQPPRRRRRRRRRGGPPPE